METPQSSNTTGFFDTFMSKLKEQSFVIILMLGGLYFQRQNYMEQLDRCKSLIDEKQAYIDKMVDAQITRMTEREKYLMDQRDRYVQDLIEDKNK
jgi:hypothetical protein